MFPISLNSLCLYSNNHYHNFNISSSLNDTINDSQIYKELIEVMEENLTLEDNFTDLTNAVIEEPPNDITKIDIDTISNLNCRTITPMIYDVLAGNFLKFAQTSKGSKFLQMTMVNTDKSFITKIFDEVKSNLPLLMVDTYANYFCKFLYPLLSYKEKFEFLENIKFSFTNIASNSKGTYALQYIIENISSDLELQSVCESIQNFATLSNLITEKNSIHVLEKIIKKMPNDSYLLQLFDFIFSKFQPFCKNKLTMRVVLALLKRDLSHFNRKKFLCLLVQNFETLINDKVGYYILYYILEVRILY
jgi:hypothetical protein